MGKKLEAGDAFPQLTLNIVGGGQLVVPGDLEGRYNILLFYRGHW